MWDSESEVTKEGALLESGMSARDDDSSSEGSRQKKRKRSSSEARGLLGLICALSGIKNGKSGRKER